MTDLAIQPDDAADDSQFTKYDRFSGLGIIIFSCYLTES